MTITAFPLSWPPGWRRTDNDLREYGRFGVRRQAAGRSYASLTDISVAEASRRLLDELERMRVQRDSIILSTNLKLRLDGLPRSYQAAPKDPGAAVYWEDPYNGQPRTMAIDLYTRSSSSVTSAPGPSITVCCLSCDPVLEVALFFRSPDRGRKVHQLRRKSIRLRSQPGKRLRADGDVDVPHLEEVGQLIGEVVGHLSDGAADRVVHRRLADLFIAIGEPRLVKAALHLADVEFRDHAASWAQLVLAAMAPLSARCAHEIEFSAVA